MWQLCREYICGLVGTIPDAVYEGVASVLCFGCVLFVVTKGIFRGLRLSGRLILAGWIFLVFCSTVFCRSDEVRRKVNLEPLWSYRAYLEGNTILLPQNIMNAVVFIPIGLLTAMLLHNVRWWGMSLIGLSLSISIEGLQYILQKGVCETDDVIHNTSGCMLGYCCYHCWITQTEFYGKRG